MENTWIKNPHALYRRLPDEVSEWLKNGWRVDVREEDPGFVFYDVDPISAFMGHSVIAYYRRAASSYQEELFKVDNV